jgi:hypothetical protein
MSQRGGVAVASAVLITAALDSRGMRTPFLLMRALFFRNLVRYREITQSETGRIGPLFWSYLVSINAMWILGLAALGAWALR